MSCESGIFSIITENQGPYIYSPSFIFVLVVTLCTPTPTAEVNTKHAPFYATRTW